MIWDSIIKNLIEAIALLFSLIAIIISIFCYFGNRKFQEKLQKQADKNARDLQEQSEAHAEFLQKEIQEYENRPKVTLRGLVLSPTDFKLYQGESVGWKVLNEQEIKFDNEVKTEKFANKIFDSSSSVSNFYCNKKNYMLINLCPENLSNPENRTENEYKNLIVCFDALKMILDMGCDNVSEIKIKAAYSMINTQQCFTDVKIDATFENIQSLIWEIPIAYAYVRNRTYTSLHLEDINNYVNESEKSIDFLLDRANAGDFINFRETAYWIECKRENCSYDYSLFIEINSDCNLTTARFEYGSELFMKKGKEASEKAQKDVIQYCIDYKQ